MSLANFKHANRWKRVNRLLQVVLSIGLIVGLNILALRHFQRMDITLSNQYTLSPETKSYIRQIDPQNPVKIYHTFSPSGTEGMKYEEELAEYVENLLEVYAYYSREAGGGRIEVEYVDIYLQSEKAAELEQKFQLDDPRAVLIEAGDKRKVILPDELMDIVNKEEIKSFKGEQAITSALIELTQTEPQKVYFLTGHNEMSLSDVSPSRGLSELNFQLGIRGFTLETLDLVTSPEVPEDAGAVVIAGPTGKFFPQEITKLQSYLNDRAGRVMVFLEVNRDVGLGDLLFQWGLRSDKMVVIDPSEDYFAAGGYFIIRQMAAHPITQELIDNQIVIITGFSRPVRQDLGAPIDDTLTLTNLFGTSSQSWAESSPLSSNQNISFDPKRDLPGPVPIASLAERRVQSRLGLEIPGGRLMVFGSGDIFTNQRLSNLGNNFLMTNTFNWMLDRENLLSIPPRPVQKLQISLTRGKYIELVLWIAVVPLCLILAGLVVNWLRRA